jgi:hypothetical protein
MRPARHRCLAEEVALWPPSTRDRGSGGRSVSLRSFLTSAQGAVQPRSRLDGDISSIESQKYVVSTIDLRFPKKHTEVFMTRSVQVGSTRCGTWCNTCDSHARRLEAALDLPSHGKSKQGGDVRRPTDSEVGSPLSARKLIVSIHRGLDDESFKEGGRIRSQAEHNVWYSTIFDSWWEGGLLCVKSCLCRHLVHQISDQSRGARRGPLQSSQHPASCGWWRLPSGGR